MSKEAHVLFLHRNLADDASVTASSAVAGAEATFTQTMDPGDAWRATGKTMEYVTHDHGQEITATHGVVAAHNLNGAGTIQRLCSLNSGFTGAHVFDSGELEAWEPVAGYGYDGYGVSYGGYPLLTPYNDYRALRLIPYGGPKTFRYSRTILRNPTNATITGVAAGRLFEGIGFQPDYNFAYDWDWDWVDPSDVIATENSVRVKRRKKYRKLRLSLPYLRTGEATGVWDDIKRTIGTSRDLFVFLFPLGASPLKLRTGLHCIPVERSGTRNPHFDVYASSMTVRELVP